MKLLEYRFDVEVKQIYRVVGSLIAKFFQENNDTVLDKLFYRADNPEFISREPINVDILRDLCSNSFLNSFSSDLNIEAAFCVRSTDSCRFVVFEDDGLIRVCHCSDDDGLVLPMVVSTEDVSRLLIDTDLFDFI